MGNSEYIPHTERKRDPYDIAVELETGLWSASRFRKMPLIELPKNIIYPIADIIAQKQIRMALVRYLSDR